MRAVYRVFFNLLKKNNTFTFIKYHIFHFETKLINRIKDIFHKLCFFVLNLGANNSGAGCRCTISKLFLGLRSCLK